ncbi:teichoic acids export ABC transporter ATP-binding subunit TagH [Bacillus anthracis]|uniref:teichoic acids export ABC transporter ATP-binding subunit TagH n=1 Tax=Bacillus TaxID=1386 RepID=UPI001925FEA0|nr:teichoic acids export ABC transporter ATP-binding subunit TagH [Bacillus anthracis]MBL3848638.1 teichoic acids export ABC transporter ATP-binding subunit TagH [Bacillus cereus]MDA1847167.1 teichoic acids export ABC transporter ATP-binding subunit TagH [Bacillus cereus]MDR4406543.1 teichoic acids export ABC transporter ATP-binding subunit TagH [Bacillus anthracis]
MNYSVKFHNVTKKYKMHSKNSDKLKNIIYPGGFGEDFYALRNLNFEAQKGDVIGIVGVNGSGKSTMSNLIAGITPPTAGNINIEGNIALIAIAAGLNNQLTGRENIELKCLMMGLSKEKIQSLTPEIIEFADIGKFIDMPVKKYSSGMKSRLGFAISVNIDPDVLVIDEALSVGDQTFTDKCLKRMNEFKEQGKTIFFVSHSLGQVKQFCTKVLWLEYGEIKDYGLMQDVMPKYEQFLKQYRAMSKVEQKKFKEEAQRKQAGEEIQQVNNINVEPPIYGYTSLKRKKDNKKKKFMMATVGLFLCIGLGSMVYWNKNLILNSQKVETVNKETTVSSEKKKNPLIDLDVRYVKAAKARIRNMPNLNGKQITLMEFGTPFIVREQKKDEKDDINWLKIVYEDGTEGWISEGVSTTIPLDTAAQYGVITNKLEELLGSNQEFEMGISLLGKNQKDVQNIIGEPKNIENLLEGALNSYKNINVLYNRDSTVKQVTIKNMSVSKAMMLEELGQAQLVSEDDSSYIYRSDKYDFEFLTVDGITVDRMSVFSHIN